MLRKIISIIAIVFSFNTFAFTVLLDPGHGGSDRGAISRGKYKTYEKDLTLKIAKEVLKKLKKKKYKVFLTRSFDRSVGLDERADMADKIEADLFVSIHINSSNSTRSSGHEIFYLDNHDDSAIKKVEEVENKDVSGTQLLVNRILADLVVERTAKTSKVLATKIEAEVNKRMAKEFKLKNRGVKPGLFYVLALAKRPAVLLEVGFISNEKELNKMSSDHFIDRYAASVTAGINEYFKTIIKKKGPNLF